MRKGDKLILTGLTFIIILVVILIVIAAIAANQLAIKDQKLSGSRAQIHISLPMPGGNISAQHACSLFKAQAWNTPAYGSIDWKGNDSAIVYCENTTNTIAIEYFHILNST